MGTLRRFNLGDIIDRHKIKFFIETGTGSGDSLAYAAEQPVFEALRSCEMVPELARRAMDRFSDNIKVGIYQDKSTDFLEDVLSFALLDSAPILFWLDAHFPGADYGLAGYAAEKDDAVRMPLERELEIIARERPLGQDVIIADDLRLFVDGPFGSGNLPPEVRDALPPSRSDAFLKTVLSNTHELRTIFLDEGYAVFTPRGKPHA